jgi:multiple sugar transport system ATP-binding protein
MNLLPARIIRKDTGLKLDFHGKLQIPIPEKSDAKTQGGMEVIMGLRPEDLTIDNGNNRFPEEWKVAGVVEVVEPLGSETYMHVELQGEIFKAKSEGRRLVSHGDEINLVMNLEHLYIFDSNTSLSIY